MYSSDEWSRESSYSPPPPSIPTSSRNVRFEVGKAKTRGGPVIDPSSLNLLSAIVCRLRDNKGFVAPQYNWYSKTCTSYSARPSLHGTTAFERARQAHGELKPAVDALKELHDYLSRQLDVCEEDMKAIRRRELFFNVPDEVLSVVLEFAALRGDDEDEKTNILKTVKSAAKLSHVCKRFRDLVTHSPRLWKYVFNGMGRTDMVYTCLQRTRRCDAEVTLTSSPFERNNYSSRISRASNVAFVETSLKLSERVGRFILEGISTDTNSMLFPGYETEYPEVYVKLVQELKFPNLTELDLRYSEHALSDVVRKNVYNQASIHFYRKWTTPKLRSMVATNIVPIPFPGSSSLTTLSIKLDYEKQIYGELVVKSFLVFLSACPTLEKLKLKIVSARNVVVPPVSYRRPEMPSIKALELSFVNCIGTPLKTLFDAIHFPHVSSMRLAITSKEDDKWVGKHFNDIFFAVLPNAEAFPALTEMTLNVDAEGYPEETPDGIVMVPGSISIPFSVMPRVRRLSFKTLLWNVNEVPGDVVLPPIRELVIRDSRLSKNWLVHFLKRMKAHGYLEGLQLTVDNGCDILTQFGLRGRISSEDLRKLIEEVEET